MAEEHCRLCMFPNLQDTSNNFTVANRFSRGSSVKLDGCHFQYPQGVNIQNVPFIALRLTSYAPNLS